MDIFFLLCDIFTASPLWFHFKKIIMKTEEEEKILSNNIFLH